MLLCFHNALRVGCKRAAGNSNSTSQRAMRLAMTQRTSLQRRAVQCAVSEQQHGCERGWDGWVADLGLANARAQLAHAPSCPSPELALQERNQCPELCDKL